MPGMLNYRSYKPYVASLPGTVKATVQWFGTGRILLKDLPAAYRSYKGNTSTVLTKEVFEKTAADFTDHLQTVTGSLLRLEKKLKNCTDSFNSNQENATNTIHHLEKKLEDVTNSNQQLQFLVGVSALAVLAPHIGPVLNRVFKKTTSFLSRKSHVSPETTFEATATKLPENHSHQALMTNFK